MPALAAAGHEVRGLARNVPAGSVDLVAVDLLERDSVVAFARDWRPEALVHLATAIPAQIKPWGVERQFEATNRLRTEGTRNLLAAAEESGAGRLIAQSVAFAVEPGAGLADERTPIWTGPDSPLGTVAAALDELEQLAHDADGVVLRLGQLHGPRTVFAADGAMGKPAARGMLPVVHRRGRESTFSFTHPRDAATAVVAALARDVRGTFNVVDDEPAPVSEWVPALSEARGSKRSPRRVPAALVRPLLGSYGVRFMTEMRGASNERAKRELDWSPGTSWREGFAED